MKRFFHWCRGVVGSFFGHHCTIHAAGLTYFSLLAVIPVLCCIFVAAKVAGVDHYAREKINVQIDAMIAEVEHGQDDEILGRLAETGVVSGEELEHKRIAALEFGTAARRISNKLFSRIANFDVGTLGWIGFALLLWTVISSLGMVEVSFNEIWRVAKPRPIWKRTYVYLFVMIVLPILSAVAMSLPVLNLVKNVIAAVFGLAAVTAPVGAALIAVLESSVFRLAVTFVFSSLSFAFFFWFMPNAKVGFRPALYGGAITAAMFGGWVRACAIAQVGIARSSVLYGSFAFLPIVLAWLYMSWQIVLLGACMVKEFEEGK